jgi:hypothetical protein
MEEYRFISNAFNYQGSKIRARSRGTFIIHTSLMVVAESTTQDNSQNSTGPRAVSSSSIADMNQNSAGGNRVWASNEKASDMFANVFASHVLGRVWPGGVPLDWVRGRDGVTTLAWSSSAQEGILTMKKTPIAARTDGSIQIEVHDPEGMGGRIFWSRQYYVIPLEVLSFTSSIVTG